MRYLTFTSEQIAACPAEIEELNKLDKYLREKFSDKYEILIKFSNTCKLTSLELWLECEDSNKFYFDAEFKGQGIDLAIDCSKTKYFLIRNEIEKALKILRNYGFAIIEPE